MGSQSHDTVGIENGNQGTDVTEGRHKMKPNILLLYPPHDTKFYPPIGLATLASHLSKTHQVEVLDPVALGLNQQQVIKCVMKRDPDEIWVSVPFTEMAVSALSLLEILAVVFPTKKIRAGGHHVEVCPEEFPWWLCNSETSTPIKIDTDTVPEWEMIPLDKYDMTMYLSTGEKALPIQSSFGCNYACAFCRNSMRREKVRYKDVDDVVYEMKWIVNDFKIHGFHFWDETFTQDNDRTAELCTAIIDSKLDVRWSAQTRLGVTNPLLIPLMREAGCVRISFGVESGDERVLKSINKGIALNGAEDEIQQWRDSGIITYAGYMIGHAEDTVESVARTMRVSRELKTDHAGFRIAIPYPGSVFREQAERKGELLDVGWDAYRDDNVVYIPEGLKGYDLKKIQELAVRNFNGAVGTTGKMWSENNLVALMEVKCQEE